MVTFGKKSLCAERDACRMPEYSSVGKERDVYGELGWITNFEVKNSKNNENRYKTFKETFD